MLNGKLSYKSILLICAAWCILWIIFHSAIMHYMGFPWVIACGDSLISNILLALACYAMSNMLRYYQPGKNSSLILLPWSLALAAFWLWPVYDVLGYTFHGSVSYIIFLKQSLPIRYIIAFLMIGWVVLISWVWHYIKTQRESENRRADAERLLKEAELTGLRQQLQPHFLFNSLNSISALIGNKPDEARRMIHQLSDFLRGTLRKDDSQLASLESELQQLQLYLEIEKVRFGHRLSTIIESDEAAKKLLLPPLLLQPIVENAIKFGLYDTTDNVIIHISAKTDNNYLKITIENPFDPTTATPRQGTGFGLNSVQRRLYLLYVRNDLLQTTADGNLFTTTVKIPQLA